MNKASSWIIGLVAIVGLYFAATWMIGHTAQIRSEQFTEATSKQFSSIFRIAERKTSNTFFGATEDLTFELQGTMATALATLRPGISVPVQFTVHNTIQYGPFPGWRGVGYARIQSELLLDESTRKMLMETVGTDHPLDIVVTLGFFGNARVNVSSPPLKVRTANSPDAIEWKGMQIAIDYSSDFRDFKVAGSAPGFSMASPGSQVSVDTIAVKADLREKFEGVYIGNEAITLAAIDVKPRPDAPSTLLVKDVAYVIDLGADGEFLNVGARIGAKNLQLMQSVLNDARFDLKVNHLHGPSVASMVKKLQTIREKTSVGATANPASFEPLKPELLTIVRQSPEIVVDRLGFSTGDGDLKITARLTVEDIADEDFTPNLDMSSLSRKMHYVIDASIAQSLIDHWPIGPAQSIQQTIAQFEQQGLAVRHGDRVETHIELKGGAVTANGKPVGGANAQGNRAK